MGIQLKACECLSPKPYENASGTKQTNICRECGGKVPEYPPLSADIGRVTIAIDAALRSASFSGDDERHAFCNALIAKLPEQIRQSILTWRANGLNDKDLAQMQALDKSRRGAV